MMMVYGQVSNCLFEDFDVAFQPVATIGKARFTGNTLTGGNGNVVFFTVSGAAPLACLVSSRPHSSELARSPRTTGCSRTTYSRAIGRHDTSPAARPTS